MRLSLQFCPLHGAKVHLQANVVIIIMFLKDAAEFSEQV